MLKSRIFKKGSSGGFSLTEIGFGTAPLGNLYKPFIMRLTGLEAAEL